MTATITGGSHWCVPRSAAVVIFGSLTITAQSVVVPKPRFEVAAIRRCEDDGRRGAGATSSPERLLVSCGTLELLIRQAYSYANGHLDTFPLGRLEGGPGWINTDHYEISAKPEGSATRAMMLGPMMQALLEDRFGLRLHREKREITAYTLTLAKGGLRIHPIEEGVCTPFVPTSSETAPLPGQKPWCKGATTLERKPGDGGSSFLLRAEEASIEQLGTILSSILDRPVSPSKPGIAGRFSFRLEFSASDATPRLLGVPGEHGGLPVTGFDSTGPSIFRAIEDQLGLKIQPSKGFGEFLVIDSVQRPSEN